MSKPSKSTKKELSPKQSEQLLRTLQARFQKNMTRHRGLEWGEVEAKLENNSEKLWSLNDIRVAASLLHLIERPQFFAVIFQLCFYFTPFEASMPGHVFLKTGL